MKPNAQKTDDALALAALKLAGLSGALRRLPDDVWVGYEHGNAKMSDETIRSKVPTVSTATVENAIARGWFIKDTSAMQGWYKAIMTQAGSDVLRAFYSHLLGRARKRARLRR